MEDTNWELLREMVLFLCKLSRLKFMINDEFDLLHLELRDCIKMCEATSGIENYDLMMHM